MSWPCDPVDHAQDLWDRRYLSDEEEAAEERLAYELAMERDADLPDLNDEERSQ